MRIVAGRFRGHPLRAPKGQTTRPTSDRVREALFSILFDVEDHRVLDLFAGTGAVGFEALSRGASHTTFVESKKAALSCLTHNADALGVAPPVYAVITQPVERALLTLAKAETKFDLVFADPPYADANIALPRIMTHLPDLLVHGGRAVFEHGPKTPAPHPSPGVHLTKTRQYGDTLLSTYTFQE